MKDMFEIRRLEVFFAASTTGFGLWLIGSSDAMGSPAFQYLLKTLPEAQWGVAFLINGLCHGIALIINGARWWSPFMRWWAAMYSVIMYAAFSGGIWAINPASTGVFTYGALSAGSGLAAFWAWRDALLAVRVQYAVNNAG